MTKVISTYLLALDELSVLTAISYQSAIEKDVVPRTNRVIDDILSLLIKAYTLGVENASTMLGYNLFVNIDAMADAIYFVIDGQTFADRVANHVNGNSLSGLQTLVKSEFHRVYNTAVQDGATRYVNAGGSGVNKTWITVKDDRVRETHSYLEGQTIDYEKEFFTFDGDHAAFPGGFMKAENNVKCRCIVKMEVKP